MFLNLLYEFCKVSRYFLEIRCDDAGIMNYYLFILYLLTKDIPRLVSEIEFRNYFLFKVGNTPDNLTVASKF